MAKVLVLYYSMYGHIETMAHAVADGANRVDGVEVVETRTGNHAGGSLRQSRGKHKTPPSPRRRSWRSMTPLSLAPRRASATCPVRCVPSSIRPAVCGRPALCIRQNGQRI